MSKNNVRKIFARSEENDQQRKITAGEFVKCRFRLTM